MGPFLDRALKMSPVFRQALCDIIIFLMNRKSRNDDYSVFHVYDSSEFPQNSLIHSWLWKSSQLAPCAFKDWQYRVLSWVLGSTHASVGGLLMVSGGLALIKGNFWCQFEISAVWTYSQGQRVSLLHYYDWNTRWFLNSIPRILNWMFKDLINQKDCTFSTCEFCCI